MMETGGPFSNMNVPVIYGSSFASAIAKGPAPLDSCLSVAYLRDKALDADREKAFF
jgi:hypothetical protein